MRFVLISAILLGLACLSMGTTLQQLSLTDMIQKSTIIVRANVHSAGATMRGATLYTVYSVAVTEQWKGGPLQQLTFAVPGGTSGTLRQAYAGAPSLIDGQEYVLFLWTSRTGLTQVIGLSQGLFSVVTQNGQCMVTRGAITDPMVNASGQLVQSGNLSMLLSDMRSQVAKVLSGVSP